MKRIWKELLLLLLAAALLPLRGACAGAEISPAAQFRQDGRLYVFAALTQWPQEAAEEAEGAAALRSGDLARDLPADHPPQRVADSGTPVSYLLLVDCSTSMTRFGGQVREMAEELAEADETGAAFTLATFGDAFHVVSAGLTGEELAAAVSEVGYIAQRSDISQGILDAAGYLRENQRQTGELTNLVIVTDGIPKYSEDSPALTEVAGELDSSILVHTFGLGGSRAEQRSLAEIGQGVHIHGGKAPGETIARYVNDLCALSFPWELDGQRSAAEIRFTWADGSEEIMPLDLNAAPLLPDTAETPEEEPAEETPQEAPPEPPEEDAPDDTAQESPAEAGDGKDMGGDKQPEAGSAGETREPGQRAVWLPAVMIAAALLAAAVLLFLLRRRRKKPGPDSVFMRLEVLSGDYAGKDTFYLTDELVIGRSARCGIPWRDREVSPKNARIFLKDRVIYIEDLGSAWGTALGGMRLHGPNRLRSGDEISIGPVRFRIKF